MHIERTKGDQREPGLKAFCHARPFNDNANINNCCRKLRQGRVTMILNEQTRLLRAVREAAQSNLRMTREKYYEAELAAA